MLFGRYAYPPNELGYCGPDAHAQLLEQVAARADDGDLRRLVRGFDGAWPYLELIAGAAGIGDPLDARVVEAYWVGNELLDRVGPTAMGAVAGRPVPRSGRSPSVRPARRRRTGGSTAAPQLSRVRRVPVARSAARGHGSTNRCGCWTAAGSAGVGSSRSPVTAAPG